MAETKKAPKNFLDEMAGQGFENMSQDNVAIPRLSVAQQMSGALDATKPAYVEGAKMGDFVMNLPPMNLGNKIQVVVLHYASWWVEWPATRGGAPIAHHVPGSINIDQSNFKEWFRKDNGNRIVESHDFVLSVIHDDYDPKTPVILNLTSTGVKTAKTWNTLLAMQRMASGATLPLFGGVWELSSAVVSNNMGTWASINTPKFIRQIEQDEYAGFIENGVAVAPKLAAPSEQRALEAPALPAGNGGTTEKIAY